MTFWVAATAVAVAAGLWLARAFLRRGGMELAEGEQAISIYRDQADSVARDAERGLISEAERAEAEREIEARALRAVRQIDNDLLAPHPSRLAALVIGVMAVAGSGLVYWSLGVPGALDQPLAERQAQLLERQAEAGDAVARATLAEEALAAGPDSFEKWWALARARSESGDHVAAAEAYRKAAEASGDDPAVLSAYAEALTLANGNKVPPAAKIVFGQVLQRQPLDLRARYYTALAKAQAQDFAGAQSDWLALYRQSPPDAPWMPTVRRDIVNMARFTQNPLRDILPDATDEEVAYAATPPPGRVPPEERIAKIEAALDEQPRNFELSIELARLYARAGQPDEATAALGAAGEQYPDAPFIARTLAETARELGLDGRRGPSDADVAVAADMTDAERGQMIDGMVARLAKRLEADPDDLDGWLMLIRSYAVLQDAENAKAAAERAYAHFDGRPQPQARIRSTAAEFGIPLS